MDYIHMEMELAGMIDVRNELTKTKLVYEQVMVNGEFTPIISGVFKFLVDEYDNIVESQNISYEEFAKDISMYQTYPWYIVVEDIMEDVIIPFNIKKSYKHNLSLKYQLRKKI